VVDGRGQQVFGRTLSAGETAGLDGVLPLRVKIGNAAGTEMHFRGQPVALVDDNGDNVVRLELK
jgi:cytoskeleton protein RodZ